MGQSVGNLRSLISHFSSRGLGTSLKMCGQRQFWRETAPYFSFVHDFSGDFFYILFHFLVIEIRFKKVN
jgi:hypothetical protein